MEILLNRIRLCWKLMGMALASAAMTTMVQAQTAPAAQAAPTRPAEPALWSHLYTYDLRTGRSTLVYTADQIWEAPNWSPDGTYLISNSKGGIYKLALKADGTAVPERLAIPDEYMCNNDKALSPDGKKLAFSASLRTTPGQARRGGSQVFLADADGNNIVQMTQEAPSYFHGWSPDGKTLAFVAKRNGGTFFEIYGMPVGGGPETQFTVNPHHHDGPDYAPDGKWVYINGDQNGKEEVWRFPPTGAGADDAKAEMVVSDGLEDWFPHISPDGKKMVYIGYPAGTPNHNPRNVQIEIKLVQVKGDKVGKTQKTLVTAMGGQGTLNVNSWAPDSERFAYVAYEAIK